MTSRQRCSARLVAAPQIFIRPSPCLFRPNIETCSTVTENPSPSAKFTIDLTVRLGMAMTVKEIGGR